MSSYLSELCRFYDRMAGDPNSGMPAVGRTSEQISFVLVIDREGRLVAVEDLRDSKGKPRRLMVPAGVKRSGNAVANFLWDKTGFVLGVGKGKPELNANYHAAFKELHEGLLAGLDSPHARALLAFLRDWKPEDFDTQEKMRDKREALLDSNVVFRLEGDGKDHYLHEEPALKEVWLNSLAGSDEKSGPQGVCLVTGQPGPIARVHPAVKGVVGAQSSGAALISFKCDAFRSYGKDQSANAPVSESAARAYTTALNFLLQREHDQTLRIGDTCMVFWADRPTAAEKIISRFLSPPMPKPESGKGKADTEEARQDKAQLARIKGILMALRRGESLNEADKELDAGATFYILGLAPNAARLSVRFWLTATLEALLRHLSQWYADLAIERQFPDTEPEFPPLWLLVVHCLAAQGKSDNVPPELAGQLARCVLSGSPVPENVFAAVLQRIHADKKVDYFRAALIKAFLCRKPSTRKEEPPMPALNKDEQNIGYRLGRAFALLEKAQKDALGKVNAPLRERYIGAASATPRLVFPLLLRLTQHHVTKASKDPRQAGYEVIFTRNMGDVLGDVTDFPATLSLADQGRFMLGYYHQTSDLYRKKGAAEGAETAEQNENPEAAE